MNDPATAIAGGPTPARRPPFRAGIPTPVEAADIVAIGQLLARYAHLLDADDTPPSAIADLFAEDGVIEPAYAGSQRHAGRAAVAGFFTDYLDRSRAASRLRRHLISTERIEVDGGTGWAFSFLDASGIQLAGKSLDLFVGSYEDDLVRRDGRWWFARRCIRLDYTWKAPGYTLCRNGQQVLDGKEER